MHGKLLRPAGKLIATAAAVAALAAAAVPLLVSAARPPAAEDGGGRELAIAARQYAYEPHRVVVDSGERIRLRLVSLDVVHGFWLEGHDLEAEVLPGKLAFKVRRPSRGEAFREVEEVTFTAGRPGKYRYRCSITCGSLHPFMQGELVVRPNRTYLAGAAATGAVTLGFFGLLWLPGRGAGRGRREWRLDLLARFGWLDRLVRHRAFQFVLVAPCFVVLVFFLFAGFFGSPIGNRNIIVTVVWIAWWFVLILLVVPLTGRGWCAVCPLPALGEWLARRRLIGVRPGAEEGRSLAAGSLNRKWPKRLSNLWLPSLLFLGMCSVSTILVTRPALTALVLGLMLLAAVAVHAVYRRRSFCRWLCPLNAWMSLYAMTGMVEVRARDPEVCAGCRARSCVRGTDGAWRCPWHEIPFRLERNNYCGLCMECVKACPNRNLTLRARPFAADTTIARWDEAWMAFIMATLVIAYSVTLLGPWGTPRQWANVTEVGDWAGFALHGAVVWLSALVVVPALWWGAAWLARPRRGGGAAVPVRTLFLRYSYLLVPLGLFAWMAFSLPLMMVNYTHVLGSLSDPLGWGWDLFGTAGLRWRPLWPEWMPYLQVPLLLTGLAVSLSRGLAIARELFPRPAEAARSLLPHGALCAAFTLVLLRLFAG
jgi:polyferredoxin/plastocyanin